MEAATDADFKKNYQAHLQHLKLKGLQPYPDQIPRFQFASLSK